MATLEKLGLEPSWKLTADANADAVAVIAQPPAPAFGPMGPVPHAVQLQGPSTLGLAVVGVATLAMYRGLQKRLTGRAPAAASVRRPAAHRRAA